MMRIERLALVVIIAGIGGACSEQADPRPTAPPPRFAPHAAATQCADALLSAIFHQQARLFSGAVLQDARNRFALVTNACSSNLSQAQELMLAYVQFTIDMFKAGNVSDQGSGSEESAVLAHWESTFPYVQYAAPHLPVEVLGPNGAAGVIGQLAFHRELNANHAAIMVPVQGAGGDPRSHLITIAPIGPGCLVGTNLAQSGPCMHFASNPSDAGGFSPKVQVGICHVIDSEEAVPGLAPALGHLVSGSTLVTTAVAAPYPAFCDDADEIASSTGLPGVVSSLRRAFSRAVGVRTLYAAHGGLGGVTTTLSPFGTVDKMVFKATFTSAAGAPPGAPEAGNLQQFISESGSILVQSSIGNLTASPVVIGRGGVHCGICGTLELRANLANANGFFATNGKYQVQWASLQDAPYVRDAPLVFRDASSREIARLTYQMTPGGNVLLYNSLPVGFWTRDVKQTFSVIVDMDGKKTSLSIDGVAIPAAQNLHFPSAANNLARLSAEFTGKDAGTVGLDDVTIIRLADQ